MFICGFHIVKACGSPIIGTLLPSVKLLAKPWHLASRMPGLLNSYCTHVAISAQKKRIDMQFLNRNSLSLLFSRNGAFLLFLTDQRCRGFPPLP